MNNNQIEFNKTLNMNRKNSSIKTCLWGGSDCRGKIIDAHSIQRGKILSAIADNGKVYYLGLQPSEGMDEMEVILKPEGIKKFSTFTGFCGYHDKNIFQPIEDVTFVGSDEQKYIYAYRAVTKELHANLESVKFYANLLGDKLHEKETPAHLTMTLQDILNGTIVVPDYIKDSILDSVKNDFVRQKYRHCEMNVIELQSISDLIKNCLTTKIYTGLIHKYHCFDEEFLLACSSSFIPYFDFEGKPITSEKQIHLLSLKPTQNPSESLNVFLNIFPENGKTHILFSYFPCNKQFSLSIDRLFQQEEFKIKTSLSNLILNYVDNIAFNPYYIENYFSTTEIENIKLTFINNMLNTAIFTNANVNLFASGDIKN